MKHVLGNVHKTQWVWLSATCWMRKTNVKDQQEMWWCSFVPWANTFIVVPLSQVPQSVVCTFAQTGWWCSLWCALWIKGKCWESSIITFSIHFHKIPNVNVILQRLGERSTDNFCCIIVSSGRISFDACVVERDHSIQPVPALSVRQFV